MRGALRQTPLLPLLIVATTTHAIPTYPIQVILRNGDSVAGVGLVTTIENVAVNNAGSWIVQVDTDNANTNVDACLVKDGTLLLREGDPVSVPGGASISSFDGISITGTGQFVGNLVIRDSITIPDTGSGVLFHDNLIILENQISAAPQFSPDTPYEGFLDARANANGQVCIVASVDDAAPPSGVDRALVIASTVGGALTAERVVAMEGDLLPGQTEPVRNFGTGPHRSACNTREQLLYSAILDGDITKAGAIYLDHTLVAQESAPSPVAGRDYWHLYSVGLDLNNYGQIAFKAALKPINGDVTDNDMIVAHGKEFIREKSTLPEIQPFRFQFFGSLEIDDLGNVLWFGDWDSLNTSIDAGLFLNDKLIVREGDALPGGGVLTAIAIENNVVGTMAMSDDGHYAVFEGTVTQAAVARNAALMIEVTGPAPVPDGDRIPGTQMRAGRNANGTDIDLTWDVAACPASKYNVFFGDLASVATYAYTGSGCGLGVTGSATVAPPVGDLFFVIASQEGDIEGVHGFDSEGRARPARAAGACGATFQIRSAQCP